MTKFFDDLTALRVNPLTTAPAVREILTKVPVQKPNKHAFFRVQSTADFMMDALIFKDKSDHDTNYFIAPNMRDILLEEWTLVKIYTGVTRQNAPFLWAVPLPDVNGRSNSYHESAHQAAKIAMTDWVRLQAEQETSSYKVTVAEATLSDPVWPNKTFNDLLEIAFAGRVIDSEDHAIVRRLRGLI